jgi:hypothetical protein
MDLDLPGCLRAYSCSRNRYDVAIASFLVVVANYNPIWHPRCTCYPANYKRVWPKEVADSFRDRIFLVSLAGCTVRRARYDMAAGLRRREN